MPLNRSTKTDSKRPMILERRQFLKSTMTALSGAVLSGSAIFEVPGRSRADAKPLRIGVLTDLSSWGRENSGPGSIEATKIAVEEFGPEVLGRKIDVISADHQMKPDIGLSIAREWFDNEGVESIVDVPNSAIGFAVHHLAREKNKIALLSGAGSSEITNKSCSPNTVQFTYDTYAVAKVLASAIAKDGGTSWFFITADYAFGHQLEADATRFIQEAGGKVVGAIHHPTGTTDFASFLLQAQSSRANVVALANAGADAVTCLKQAGEFGIVQGGQRLAALLLFAGEVHAVGLKAAQNTYLTTASYWNMTPETRAWSKAFFPRANVMPNMIHTGCYGATLHYLKAVAAAGTVEAGAVMRKMRELPIHDAFLKGGILRPDGRVIRDMYLARVKKPEESEESWDILDIVRTVNGEDAYRPISESACPLLRS